MLGRYESRYALPGACVRVGVRERCCNTLISLSPPSGCVRKRGCSWWRSSGPRSSLKKKDVLSQQASAKITNRLILKFFKKGLYLNVGPICYKYALDNECIRLFSLILYKNSNKCISPELVPEENRLPSPGFKPMTWLEFSCQALTVLTEICISLSVTFPWMETADLWRPYCNHFALKLAAVF